MQEIIAFYFVNGIKSNYIPQRDRKYPRNILKMIVRLSRQLQTAVVSLTSEVNTITLCSIDSLIFHVY